MSDLIELAIAKIQEQEVMAVSEMDRVYNQALHNAIAVVKGMPSAQPEIVRCRDCIKREICRTTSIWAVAPDDDWFCADGERREDV